MYCVRESYLIFGRENIFLTESSEELSGIGQLWARTYGKLSGIICWFVCPGFLVVQTQLGLTYETLSCAMCCTSYYKDIWVSTILDRDSRLGLLLYYGM